MCLGATYSWSVYVHPIKMLTGLLQGAVQIPFTVFYFTFPAVMMLAGMLLPRLGTRRSAMLGGAVFGSGWILAGMGHIHFAFTVLGIGLLGGIGAGFAYIVPIAVCIQWFPRHKGLVTGIAVAGFGGGAALVSQVGGSLMALHSLTPFQTFSIFGTVFLILVVAAGSAMNPPEGKRPQKIPPLNPKSLIAVLEFRILYFAMFMGLVAGFTVNANLKELYTGLNTGAGIAAVSIFAIANAGGRIVWGTIFDRLAATSVIEANLVFQALVIGAAPWILHTAAGLWAFAALTGFNYGGVLVIYVSTAARRWGNENVARIYGWLFTSNIPAAISPMIAGAVYDRLGSFSLPLWVIAGLLVLTAFILRQAAKEYIEYSEDSTPHTNTEIGPEGKF